MLLIRKKRGLGAGKVIGPGGRLQPGESPVMAAVRETAEEVGIEVEQPALLGQLSFQFADGYALLVYAFLATRYRGEVCSSDEAEPLWTPVDRIPYDEMWADDRHWLPLLLARRRFRGWFDFDGDRMLSCRLECDD